MKVVLDLDQLLADGQITTDEYERMQGFARRETGALAQNLLVGFGVIATAGGALAVLPSVRTVLVLGAMLALAGVLLCAWRGSKWGALGSMLLLVGALTFSGGVIALTEGSGAGLGLVVLVLMVAALLARSALLAILATLALLAMFGAASTQETNTLGVRGSTWVIVIFSVLALACYHLSKRLRHADERVVLAVARTSLLLVNGAFFVGTVWGDTLFPGRPEGLAVVIPAGVFAIGWAVGLLATGVWAARANRRWVVNLTAVFGTMLFYAQYFARLEATPGSLMGAGLVAMVIALALGWYNKSGKPATTEPAG
jgi:iron complex transport system permease protein